ncbi:MAG: hypothetical protein V6Z89_20430 [Desulfobacter sp.]
MLDFTLDAYKVYLGLLKKHHPNIITFSEYFSGKGHLNSFCIIRHDVDRNPESALKIAEVENDMGIRSTYYFRTKKHVLNIKILRKIKRLGHETGYHYESWADHKGEPLKALQDFQANLETLRRWVPVDTIAMHGRPLSGFDNRDMWQKEGRAGLLGSRFNITGEVYLDIDYSDIAYISDTGRNWHSSASNIQDRVVSQVTPDFKNREALLAFLEKPHPKMIFLTHPERWQDSVEGYALQMAKDWLINLIKMAL